MSTQPKLPGPGDTVHFLKSGVTFPAVGGSGDPSHVSRRGQNVTLTAELIEAAKDRNGAPGWISLVFDDTCQWVQFGPAPSDMSPWEPGSVEEVEQREEARKRAWRLEDCVERAAARQAVADEFGPAPITSKTINAAARAAPRPSGRVSR